MKCLIILAAPGVLFAAILWVLPVLGLHVSLPSSGFVIIPGMIAVNVAAVVLIVAFVRWVWDTAGGDR